MKGTSQSKNPTLSSLTEAKLAKRSEQAAVILHMCIFHQGC